MAIVMASGVLIGTALVVGTITRSREALSICQRTDRLLDAAEAADSQGSEPVARLDALLPSEVDAPFRFVEDVPVPHAETLGAARGPAWLSELEQDGFRRGLVRRWSAPGGTLADAFVYEFDTHEGALAFQRFALEGESCPYSSDVFEVDGVPGSIGLQIRWSNGTESEQVSFVRGPRRYLANVRAASVPDRDLVLSLTDSLSETAR